ncbi:GNAT family N-acetyltransferase [Tolypothrix bouteillei VB521301_2]|uniref:GNAT family N-acetyltransferase n=1 Tax=Tolypothrix bouteillei VB521301 TaxID=1479485 RepID=A0A0C1NLY9_9CYAN|nr:GNAT family N-acetyltransferase [Tolypothrix bouteillei]KAF3884075.1 GNAT family N-acetyltransferase [Tolypothrix bouteillei VB521301]
MSIDFRTCTESDFDIVQKYVLSLYQEDLLGMKMNSEKIQKTFREFTHKPDKGRIIVFDRDNTVVGYAIVVFFWSNEYGGDFVEVDELFVQKGYRGNGIGTAFFQWLEKTWGTSSVALSLQTTPSNERTLAFYERMGFRASPNHHLMKLLSPEVTEF